MEDIGLFKQGWKWVQSKSNNYSAVKTAAGGFRDKIGKFMERHWPMVCSGCTKFWRLVLLVLRKWKDSTVRGFRSIIELGSAALLIIMWSCFLSLTSMTCLVYVLLSMGAAGTAIQYLGYTPGLFIVGLFAILILWMYANFWITGTLFVVGGYLFSRNHARVVVLVATLYAIYCVKVRVGWFGVLLSINLSFISNDIFNYLLPLCDNVSESQHFEEQKESESESITEDDISGKCDFSVPTEEAEKLQSCKSSSKAAATMTVISKLEESSTSQIVKEDASSVDEMNRILCSVDHYDALGFQRHKKIDAASLKKEYRKKTFFYNFSFTKRKLD